MKDLKEKLGLIGFELALVGVLWVLFIRDHWLGVVLVAAVLLSGLAPQRYAQLASGLALLGVAAFFYFYAGMGTLAAVLGAFGGVLALFGAVAAFGRRGGDGAGRGPSGSAARARRGRPPR